MSAYKQSKVMKDLVEYLNSLPWEPKKPKFPKGKTITIPRKAKR